MKIIARMHTYITFIIEAEKRQVGLGSFFLGSYNNLWSLIWNYLMLFFFYGLKGTKKMNNLDSPPTLFWVVSFMDGPLHLLKKVLCISFFATVRIADLISPFSFALRLFGQRFVNGKKSKVFSIYIDFKRAT